MSIIATSDVYVGRDYGKHAYTITPELVETYSRGVEGAVDQNPWYTGDSPFGGPVAPALIRHSEVYRYHGWYLPDIYGNLHAKQEWELFAPLRVGDAITTRATLIDRYRKRDRQYVVLEAQYFAANGRLLSRGRTHQSFLIDRERRGTVVDKDREKASSRRFELAEGPVVRELEPLAKEITLDMCLAFTRWHAVGHTPECSCSKDAYEVYGPEVNYHNDREAAQKLGFPDIVIQGMQPICILSEMLTRNFGAGWFTGGKMAINLVNVLWFGEPITCRGLVRAEVPEGERTRATCDVWVEKADGTKIIIGTASAPLGPPAEQPVPSPSGN